MKIRVRKSLYNFNSEKYFAIYIIIDFDDEEICLNKSIKRDLWWDRALALHSAEVL